MIGLFSEGVLRTGNNPYSDVQGRVYQKEILRIGLLCLRTKSLQHKDIFLSTDIF